MVAHRKGREATFADRNHMFEILAAAVLITAQPLADEDVLEPSVQNEVDHALSLAPEDTVPVSEESVAFAALYATNGMPATARAIALVSSQKEGRWTYAGRDVTPAACRLLRKASGVPEPPLKLSVFSDHVETVAKQERIPFAEAAAKVRGLGIDGLDITSIPDDRLAEAKALGFSVACVVGWPEFEKGYDEAACSALLDRARTNGCRRILLVPGFYPEGCDVAQTRKAILERTNRFAAEAARFGIETLVEDFDNARSPTYGRARTSAFLADAPSVGFVYDTGNFNNQGERAEDGLALLPRVRHFHLKDRPSPGSAESAAVGSGAVPFGKIVPAALDAGYGGWFTIEHFGVTNMLESIEKSVRFLRAQRF